MKKLLAFSLLFALSAANAQAAGWLNFILRGLEKKPADNEEALELTKELSKNLRGQDNAAHIAEEIADVEIMLEELKLMFCIRDEVTQQRTVKLQRLDNRISQSLIHPKP